jgi:hypothetical protein
MTGKLTVSLGLLVGFVAATARAQDVRLPYTRPGSSGPAGVSLGRPVAAPVSPSPSFVEPTSFVADAVAPSAPVVRAQAPETPVRTPSGFSDSDVLRTPEPPLAEKNQQPELLPKPKTSKKPAEEPSTTWEGDCGGTLCPSPANVCPPDSCCDPCPLGCDGCPCPSECCPCCNCFGGQDRCMWFSGEYLGWATKHASAPALVTTSPQTSGGVLGHPGTSVLFGGPLDFEDQSGGRFTIGYWFDGCATFGIEGVFMFLAERSDNFSASSNGNPLLARPFFNVVTGAEDAELIANLPNLPRVLPLTGRVDVHAKSKLDGAELNFIYNLCRSECSRLDLIAGFRWLELQDNLRIDEHLLVPDTSPMFAGSTFDLFDQFQTRNNFYGGQIGLKKDWRWKRWDFELKAKVALGDMSEHVDINGATTITQPGMAPATFPGGLLAQPTNIGSYNRNTFAVVPEGGLTIGYQVTERLKIFVGYDFLYVSNAVRPGNAIDRGVNPTQLPSVGGAGQLVGPARPAFVFKDSDYWAQGVSLGLEFKY